MKIAKLLAALCAGAALQTAMAAPVEPPPSAGPVPATASLRSAFAKASALPAPSHSLYTPDSKALARTLFNTADIVIFGELHHSTNYKFLAENPAFFREAAAHGAKNIYIELPVRWKPVTDAWFTGHMSDAVFEDEVRQNFSDIDLTAGSPSDDYIAQFLALCKTAKQAGLQILPTDFRILSASPGTSDVLGIPDIMRHDDAVLAQTKAALHQYEQETGQHRPVTAKDFYRFNKLYFAMLENLPLEAQHTYGTAFSARQKEWNDADRGDNLTAFQNELQARYSAMIDRPGDKAIFIGGSRHVVAKDSIGDYARHNGHKRIASIELLSQSGLLWRSGLESLEDRALYQTTRAFAYRIETDHGKIIPLPATPPQIRQDARTLPVVP